MLKLLLVLAVLVFGLMLWFGKGRQRSKPTPPARHPPPTPAAPQAMLSCVRCGVHLPQSEAFLDDNGRAFCGAEHRRLGPRSGSAL